MVTKSHYIGKKLESRVRKSKSMLISLYNADFYSIYIMKCQTAL